MAPQKINLSIISPEEIFMWSCFWIVNVPEALAL
jgi:hypothetical protein